jgi:hypothetical protein
MAQRFGAQQQSQASLESHVADLGKVVGQLGLEVDDRLTLVEMVVEGLGGSDQWEGRQGAEPPEEAASPG